MGGPFEVERFESTPDVIGVLQEPLGHTGHSADLWRERGDQPDERLWRTGLSVRVSTLLGLGLRRTQRAQDGNSWPVSSRNRVTSGRSRSATRARVGSLIAGRAISVPVRRLSAVRGRRRPLGRCRLKELRDTRLATLVKR